MAEINIDIYHGSWYIKSQLLNIEVIMKNKIIAEMLEQIADILEFQGDQIFKINAYRKASRVLQDLQTDIETRWQEKRLRELPGIGEAMVKKIDEFLTTGKMSKFEELTQAVPAELIELLRIQNLGPKTLALAHQKLGVRNLADLTRVIENGSLAELPGLGLKKVENIRKGIELFQTARSRISIGTALPIIENIIQELTQRLSLSQLSPAGSVRRMKETVGDLDLLAATDTGAQVIDTFVHLPMAERVLAAGETKGSILVAGGLQVDVRAVPPDSFGAALQYFTGSQAHNIKLRGLAKKQGLKISEYGVFREDQVLAGRTEAEVYQQLDLPWIPPELREDRGEIEAAASGNLPELLELQDIQGDLHVHSHFSDGLTSMEEMVERARAMGYRYLAFCEHSQSAYYAHGLAPDRLAQQCQQIAQLNQQFPDFQIFTGTEVDILPDGRLDFPDEILAKLDLVVASIHSAFKQRPTERILAALANPYVDIIGHPTGRLISRREGYEVDLNAIFEMAAKTGKALEINAYPDRLDLSDVNARRASEMGILLAINTDAHHPDQLSLMKFGVATARRGWLSRKNVLNTLSPTQIQAWKKLRLEK